MPDGDPEGTAANAATVPGPSGGSAPSGDDQTLPANPGVDATLGLRDEELLADRYRIVRFIARGGMGEVYEAADTELGERVAVKVMRGELQGVSGLTKRELQLARRVTHRNVCRIFDVGFHDGPTKVVFLTMELLRGETLAKRLRRVKRLSTAEALPIVEQIAAALAAAHAVGIVHRDLKSENVFLEEDDRGLRAVVTDFGLARATTDDTMQSLSGEGLLGTPLYMAPEQVKGLPATASADVYALGVLLFEIVTGTFPFKGATALETATRRLEHPAPSARARVLDLDPRWERTIAWCLEREAPARPPDVGAVIASLRGAVRPPRRRRAWIGVAAAAAIAVAVGLAVWTATRRDAGDAPLALRSAPATATVHAAEPANAEAARLYADGLARLRRLDAQGARDALDAALVADPSFPLAWSALAVAWSQLGDDEQARSAAQRAFELSAGLSRADRLLVEARLLDLRGERDKALELYRSLFEFLPDRIDVGLSLAAVQTQAGHPDDAAATLARLRALGPGDDDARRIDLADATAAATRGDHAQARDLAHRAVVGADAEAAPVLAAKARAIEGWAHFKLGDADAAEALFVAAEAALDQAGARSELASVQIKHAAIPWRAGDLVAARRLVDAAQRTFRELGNLRGQASALTASGILMMQEVRGDAALPIFREALAICETIGDRTNLSLLHMQIGNVELRGGRLDEARKSYDEALHLAREVGDKERQKLILQNLALLLLDQQELDAAAQHYRDAIAIGIATDDGSTVAYCQNGLGDIAQDRGDPDIARKHYQAGLAAATAADDPLHAAQAKAGIAEASLKLGDPTGAATMAEEAGSALEALHELDSAADALAIAARARVQAGDPAGARGTIDRAARLAEASTEPLPQLTVALVDAQVRVAEGDLTGALRVSEATAKSARRLELRQTENAARLQHARALIAAGRGREGRAEAKAVERDAAARRWVQLERDAAALAAE